jgi:hypothetical protein
MTRSAEDAYHDKAPHARPHMVVRQLSPSALVHDRPLVHTATDQVYQYGNHDYDTKHSTRTQGLSLHMDTTACVWRSALEHVYAFVYLGDEGDGGLGERIRFAEEGDDGGFAAVGRLFPLGRGVVIVIVIVVAVNYLPSVEIDVDGG